MDRIQFTESNLFENINSKTCDILNLAIADSNVPIITAINPISAKNNTADNPTLRLDGIIIII